MRFFACGTFTIHTIAHKYARTYINIVVLLNRQYILDLVFSGVRNAHPFTYTCLSVTRDRWVFFSGFPTDKTDRQDITEILLKVVFKHCNPNPDNVIGDKDGSICDNIYTISKW